jgi:hypothetical protein
MKTSISQAFAASKETADGYFLTIHSSSNRGKSQGVISGSGLNGLGTANAKRPTESIRINDKEIAVSSAFSFLALSILTSPFKLQFSAPLSILALGERVRLVSRHILLPCEDVALFGI